MATPFSHAQKCSVLANTPVSDRATVECVERAAAGSGAGASACVQCVDPHPVCAAVPEPVDPSAARCPTGSPPARCPTGRRARAWDEMVSAGMPAPRPGRGPSPVPWVCEKRERFPLRTTQSLRRVHAATALGPANMWGGGLWKTRWVLGLLSPVPTIVIGREHHFLAPSSPESEKGRPSNAWRSRARLGVSTARS